MSDLRQYDGGRNDKFGMRELLAFDIGMSGMNGVDDWCDDVRKPLTNRSDCQMTHNNPYDLPTYLDFFLMAREDIQCFDAIMKCCRPVQLRFAAFLMQQAIEKLLKALLTHDGYQQNIHDHDIEMLIDECQHTCDTNRIDLPYEIAGNADEISGWYRRDVKCLPSDEIMSDVYGALPSFMKSCFEYCGEASL